MSLGVECLDPEGLRSRPRGGMLCVVLSRYSTAIPFGILDRTPTMMCYYVPLNRGVRRTMLGHMDKQPSSSYCILRRWIPWIGVGR